MKKKKKHRIKIHILTKITYIEYVTKNETNIYRRVGLGYLDHY